MTQDEIIEMARQAGMMTTVLYLGRNLELLTNFAKLIAQHERKNFCAQLAQLHDSYSLASHTTTLRGQE